MIRSERAWLRIIAHADMDAFYAAIEQRDDPSLRGRPLLVGPPSARGVVLTASYEARPYGVGSAMPMATARRMCPSAVIVPPRFDRYQEVSATIMKVFSDFSPDVEALSLDEAFLDMTGSEQLFGDPESIGRRLKAAVREVTGGLTASVGLSATKYVAKVASVCQKPDGLTVVRPEEAKAWLAPLAVSWLWGAGPKTQARLHQLGLHTIGDVARADPRLLSVRLGRASFTKHRIRAYARRGCAREGRYQISPASIGRHDRKTPQKKELRGLRCRREAQDRRLPDYNAPTPAQRTDRRCG